MLDTYWSLGARHLLGGGPHKELVLVAAEVDGRVHLAHAETNDKATLKRFADGQVRPTPA